VRPLAPTNSLLRSRAAPQLSSPGASVESSDLFAGNAAVRRSPAAKRRPAPELAAARVLCRQLGRKRVSSEKRRIAHLICLNLLAVLNRRPQQA
jgi:hypothetical protein